MTEPQLRFRDDEIVGDPVVTVDVFGEQSNASSGDRLRKMALRARDTDASLRGLLPAPSRIISSSCHSVPSKNTAAAPDNRLARPAVSRAQPGTKKKETPRSSSTRTPTTSSVSAPISGDPSSR